MRCVALVLVIVATIAAWSAVAMEDCPRRICDTDVACAISAPYRCWNATTNSASCYPGRPPAGFCTSVCNVRSCSTTTCRDKCSKEVCDKSTCSPVNDRYECTAGSAAPNGNPACSPSPDYFVNVTSCRHCCDVLYCVPQLVCNPCTEAQCATLGSRCGAKAPYICLKGFDEAACSAQPWKRPLCSGCCNAINCPH